MSSRTEEGGICPSLALKSPGAICSEPWRAVRRWPPLWRDIKKGFARTIEPLGIASAAQPADWREDGGYWAKVRKQFMLEDGFAYLNTGTLGPTPRPVYDAMVEYWRLMAVNPNENSNVFQERQDQIRAKAAAFIGATPDEVALTRNTTEGNTILCQGLDLKAGDEILMTAFEHASNRETWMRQAKRFGLVVKQAKFPLPPTNAQILAAFEAAITPRTRVMHFNNPLGGYGCYLPVKQLAELAHSRKILCFVDGAHCIGMVQFSVSEWGIDGFACNAHKWLCGPAGAGLLYVKRELQDRVWPVMGYYGEQPKGARKYDQLSRRPWPCVMALEDTLDFQLAIGRARIEDRGRALGSYLRRNASEIPKVKVYTPRIRPCLAPAPTWASRACPVRACASICGRSMTPTSRAAARASGSRPTSSIPLNRWTGC